MEEKKNFKRNKGLRGGIMIYLDQVKKMQDNLPKGYAVVEARKRVRRLRKELAEAEKELAQIVKNSRRLCDHKTKPVYLHLVNSPDKYTGDICTRCADYEDKRMVK